MTSTITTGIETRTRKGRTIHRVRIRRRGHHISEEFDVLEDAALWRSAALAALRDGREVPPRTTATLNDEPAATAPTHHRMPTVEEAADDLIRGIRRGVVRNKKGEPFKASVTDRYESVLRVHVLERIGGAYVDDLWTADVQEAIDEIAADAHPATAHKALTALRVLYRRAVLLRLVPVSPCVGVTAPHGDPKPIRVLTLAEADRIIAAAEDLDQQHRDEAKQIAEVTGRPPKDRRHPCIAPILTLAFSTGMRAGELLALRYGPDSLDLHRGLVTVGPLGNLSRKRDKETGVFPLIAPKTRASRRDFVLPPSVVARLRRHRLQTGRPADGAFVFADANGDPLCGATVLYRDWRRVIDRAGIDDPRPRLHDARHHWAIHMLRAGVIPQVVAKNGGWGSTKMALDRYGKHVLPGEAESAAEKLDAYLAQRRKAGAR